MTNISNDFYIKLNRVVLAHELVAKNYILSDYKEGRRVYGMSFAVSGEAEYRAESGERIRVKSGDILFFSASSSYLALSRSAAYHHYTVNFELAEPVDSGLLSRCGITSLSSTNAGVYKSLFAKLADVWHKKQFGYEMRASSLLYELFSEFFSELSMKRINSYSYRLLLPAKDFIDENYSREMSVTALAALVRMSETHFRREFRKVFGTSPMKYRDRMRILHAKDALASGAYTVSETAEICGFSDLSYFARFFKKHTGVSPTEFKDKS